MVTRKHVCIEALLDCTTQKDCQRGTTKLKSCPSYTDLKRTPREFNVGDHVYLKVKSKKSSLSLGRCSKLAPRYCGHFEVLDKIGPVAYQLALPPTIKVHDVFHVSLLKIYIYMMLLI